MSNVTRPSHRHLVAFGAAAMLSFAAVAQTPSAASVPPVVGGVQVGIAVTDVDVVAHGWSAKRAFLGHKVVNAEGKTVGKIEDLIIAPDKSLSFAILEVGGFLGLGEHRIAIPVGQFKFGPKGQITLPGATKDALKQLPKFVYAKR